LPRQKPTTFSAITSWTLIWRSACFRSGYFRYNQSRNSCCHGRCGRCDSSWQLIAANSTGDTQLSQFNNPNNAAIGLLAATSTHLYIGFDNADGIVIFRTTLAAPTARTDWTGSAGCDAASHPASCDSVADAIIGASHTRIFDGKTITSGGTTSVFVVAGDGRLRCRSGIKRIDYLRIFLQHMQQADNSWKPIRRVQW